tara:strand:+ start:156 stop:443 length:288 start_codon:yes stop_codon:yes gene_type:complete
MADANKDLRTYTIETVDKDGKTPIKTEYKVEDMDKNQVILYNRLEKLSAEKNDLNMLLVEKEILINSYNQSLIKSLQPERKIEDLTNGKDKKNND